MRIKEITYQYRRDFEAVFECEHCGATSKEWGYDDRNFHENVIPNMTCKQCGKKAPASYRPLKPKYPHWLQI